MRSFLIVLPVAMHLATAQTSLGSHPNLMNGDMAVLEGGEQRRDIACTVTPEKPLLGFDLKFHAGYDLDIPMRDLVGPGNTLSILFRVTAKNSTGEPVYLNQKFQVPAITDDQGHVTLEGAFDVGQGPYHVDWLMHDFAGRFCSSYWDIDAELAANSKQVEVALGPGKVQPSVDEQFQPEPPVIRSQEGPQLSVKVLMNFAPGRPDAPELDPSDRVALISILRNISRSPQIGKFSLVAFNVDEQKILYRQDAADQIDFPELGRAVKQNLALGTVNLTQLQQKHPDTEFLEQLVKKETAGANVDGLIFVGPKTMLNRDVPDEDLKQIGDLDYPVFYMNYTPDPQAIPWKDSVSRMVKSFKGREYTISCPKDLWNAVTEVVSRIAKFKQARISAAATGLNDNNR
ncbi:MAG TPA: hypothetical protein VMG40_14315 [Bryobacteraceae bacterium]|nr:hypothetical protein [Bryobacteraceae bacterium]